MTVTVAATGLMIDGPDAGAVFSASETVAFTTTNWSTAQTVTIEAPGNDANTRTKRLRCYHSAANTGATASGYAGIAKSLSVTIDDNDDPGIVLSESMLTVAEANSVTVDYTVQLATLPTADVTVTVHPRPAT